MVSFILSTLKAATPLTFCALAVVLAERCGVLLVSIEGLMLLGAFTSIFGMFLSNSLFGLVITILVGIIFGIFLAAITVLLPANQLVTGIAFNIFILGFTSFLFRLYADKMSRISSTINSFFGLSPFTILVIIITFGMWWFIFKTGPGLKIRATGEDAHSAHAAGIEVNKVRFFGIVVAAILAGLGGAALTMGWTRSFVDNVTLGRGFIGLAAAYCGRWNPIFALIACIIFGAGEALAFRMQAGGIGVNPHFFFMLPYVLTLIIFGIVGQSEGPKDVGNHYAKK